MNVVFYQASKTCKLLTSCIVLASFSDFANVVYGSGQDKNDSIAQQWHHTVVEEYYDNRKELPSSNLGSILFKNIDPKMFKKSVNQAKTFKIMVWAEWMDIVASYLQGAKFDSLSVTDEILAKCSVKNCIYNSSYSVTDLPPADAVIFTTQVNQLPVNFKRDPQQRWILWSRGHPAHEASRWTNRELEVISDYFNWSMCYRTGSDIPIPYGRTVPLQKAIDVDYNDQEGALRKLVPYWHKKQTGTLAMAIIDKHKLEYNKLAKYLSIDFLWKSCPRQVKMDCVLPEKYLFYVAFEDSSRREFISETVFHHAYSKGAIPIIINTPLQDCEKLLPPHSFLHVQQYYQNISDLITDMMQAANDYGTLLNYHMWRQHFAVTNEHGLFNTSSLQLCRVCEALNYNDGGAK